MAATGVAAVCVDLIVRRRQRPRLRRTGQMVFPSVLGNLRDPSNTSSDLRRVLDGIGCSACGDRIRPQRRRPASALRRGLPRLGHLPHLPQDRRDQAGPSRPDVAPDRGPARSRAPFCHPGCVHGPKGRHRGGTTSARPVGRDHRRRSVLRNDDQSLIAQSSVDALVRGEDLSCSSGCLGCTKCHRAG
jgi:hypothetical protein